MRIAACETRATNNRADVNALALGIPRFDNLRLLILDPRDEELLVFVMVGGNYVGASLKKALCGMFTKMAL